MVIEPMKNAKKSPPAHPTERASNDPRARRRQAKSATADEPARAEDDTTRRNSDIGQSQDVDAIAAPAERPDVKAPPSRAPDTSNTDDVPTVEASMKVSLQNAGTPPHQDFSKAPPQSERVAGSEKPAPSATDSPVDGLSSTGTDGEARVSNDPRGRHDTAQKDGSDDLKD